jgi:acyl-coenzyme A synthetase/AMP-(fatty) acid ligase
MTPREAISETTAKHIVTGFFMARRSLAGCELVSSLWQSECFIRAMMANPLRYGVAQAERWITVLPMEKACIAHEMLGGAPNKRGKIVLSIAAS